MKVRSWQQLLVASPSIDEGGILQSTYVRHLIYLNDYSVEEGSEDSLLARRCSISNQELSQREEEVTPK